MSYWKYFDDEFPEITGIIYMKLSYLSDDYEILNSDNGHWIDEGGYHYTNEDLCEIDTKNLGTTRPLWKRHSDNGL